MPASPDLSHLQDLTYDQLLALVRQLGLRVEELSALVKTLQEENERLQRAGLRQAAPFSKGEPKPNPKKPGRKKGSGDFTFRQAPAPEAITEPIVCVPVEQSCCPCCGGALELQRVERATNTDLPEVIRPRVKAFDVEVRRCCECGKSVRGTHPELAPDQSGASAHRLSERVMAGAHLLHFHTGVPVRRVPSVLKVLCGITLTQSAITRDCLRRSKREMGRAYSALRVLVAQSERTYTDDTGWRVAGKTAYLMAFESESALEPEDASQEHENTREALTTQEALTGQECRISQEALTGEKTAVYQVRDRHRNEEVRELISSFYSGSLIADRGPSYDAKELSGVKQSKCITHALGNISEVLEKKEGPARSFGLELTGILRECLDLWHREREARERNVEGAGGSQQAGNAGGLEDYEAQAQRLKERLTHHLRDRTLPDPDNQRLLTGLGWHHDRGNLVRFLDDPRIEPTNNRAVIPAKAGRALRPAIIQRKVSHCSKNDEGAQAFSCFLSVIRTLHLRGAPSLIDALCNVFRTGIVPSSSTLKAAAT